MRRKITVFRRELLEWAMDVAAPVVSFYALIFSTEILVLQTIEKVL